MRITSHSPTMLDSGSWSGNDTDWKTRTVDQDVVALSQDGVGTRHAAVVRRRAHRA